MPFDLVKKQPKGHQTFALMTKDVVTGSLTTDVRPTMCSFTQVDSLQGVSSVLCFYLHKWIYPPQFTYLEPSEVRSWQPPTPASTKRVEMDRTVMPCGTVVTTITAVKSKPGRPLPPGLSIGTGTQDERPVCAKTLPGSSLYFSQFQPQKTKYTL